MSEGVEDIGRGVYFTGDTDRIDAADATLLSEALMYAVEACEMAEREARHWYEEYEALFFESDPRRTEITKLSNAVKNRRAKPKKGLTSFDNRLPHRTFTSWSPTSSTAEPGQVAWELEAENRTLETALTTLLAFEAPPLELLQNKQWKLAKRHAEEALRTRAARLRSPRR